MPTGDAFERLNDIDTLWGVVWDAHHGTLVTTRTAREQLLERYGPAARGYLYGALRDEPAAADLFQQFALRVLDGSFQRADPQRGRFRDYVKTTLFHLLAYHQRLRRQQPLPLDAASAAVAVEEPPGAEEDRTFLTLWRHELLGHAWAALARHEEQTGQPVHTVLRLQVEHPLFKSPQLAQELGQRLGQPVTADWVRKWLGRARELFADCLVAEVAGSLDPGTAEQLEQELIDLELLDRCRDALERRRADIWCG